MEKKKCFSLPKIKTTVQYRHSPHTHTHRNSRGQQFRFRFPLCCGFSFDDLLLLFGIFSHLVVDVVVASIVHLSISLGCAVKSNKCFYSFLLWCDGGLYTTFGIWSAEIIIDHFITCNWRFRLFANGSSIACYPCTVFEIPAEWNFAESDENESDFLSLSEFTTTPPPPPPPILDLRWNGIKERQDYTKGMKRQKTAEKW